MKRRPASEIIHFLAAPDTPSEGAFCVPGTWKNGPQKRHQYVATRELETVTCGMCLREIQKLMDKLRCKAK